MDYNQVFKTRADSYMYAINHYKHAMQEEFDAAVEVLDVPDDGCHIVHVQAAGIPLFDRGFEWYHPFETSPDFARFGFDMCTYEHIPLPDGSMDRAIILASLHHASDEERCKLFRELHRVCNSGARFVIGDVCVNSRMDRWLNEFVDTYNPSGHKGRFFSPIDEHFPRLLEQCGWTLSHTEMRRYTWRFDSESDMCDFVVHLFGLSVSDKGDDWLKDKLREYLKFWTDDDGQCYFEWELLFFVSYRSYLQEDPSAISTS